MGTGWGFASLGLAPVDHRPRPCHHQEGGASSTHLGMLACGMMSVEAGGSRVTTMPTDLLTLEQPHFHCRLLRVEASRSGWEQEWWGSGGEKGRGKIRVKLEQ